jgi:hypothetical protein
MRFLILTIGFSFVVGSLTAQDVVPPLKRMETLDLARKLLTTSSIHLDAETVAGKNPFNPQAAALVEQPAAAPAAVVMTADRDLLVMLAPSISPSGAVRLGDTSILLFGQKKFKVGDVLPIVFQGVTYELVIAAIEQTNFTLRLNKEEITRPIKPTANTP